MIKLVKKKKRQFLNNKNIEDKPEQLKIALNFLKKIDNFDLMLDKMMAVMARTRGGLNNPARQNYFNNRRFLAQKEIQQRRKPQIKIKLVFRRTRL